MSITEKIRYGAIELKEIYNRNLGIALGVSVGLHLALIFLYVFSLNVGNAKSDINRPPISKMSLENIAPPPEQPDVPPPPPPMIPPSLQTGGGTGGVEARAGTPVAVPDALIDPKLKDFATTKDIQIATPKGGDGTGVGGTADGKGIGQAIELPKNIEVKEKDKLPSIDEFIETTADAQWDQAGLQRRIVYPEVAKRAGIQGIVVVRALVGTDGKVVKCAIDKSDSKVLEEEAVRAVKATPFIAAVNGAKPVAVWVQVEVHFKLE